MMVSLAALVSGCGNRGNPARGLYRSADSAYALAARVVNATQSDAARGTCGHASGGRPPTEIVLVTGRACLSCRGIGHLIRASSRPAAEVRVLVAIPIADSAEVCDFLKRERITNTVVGVSQQAFPGDAVGSVVVVASLDPVGRLREAAFGTDAVDLLPRVEAWRRHP